MFPYEIGVARRVATASSVYFGSPIWRVRAVQIEKVHGFSLHARVIDLRIVGDTKRRWALLLESYLTKCIYQLVLDSQLPRKTVNLILMSNSKQ